LTKFGAQKHADLELGNNHMTKYENF